MKKKLFLFVAGILLAMTGMAQTTVVANGTCGENLTWTLTSDSTLTISGTGEMSNYGSYDQPWNAYREEITTVEIELGVTSIGRFAFYILYQTVKVVTIPNSVTSIGGCAFGYCSMASITIPSSVTSIGDYAFTSCRALTSITIPNSVTSIGQSAFSSCTNLSNVIFEDGPATLSLDQSNPSKNIFQNCPISNSYIGRNINSSYVFRDLTTLTTLIIGDSVTSISNSAFSGCIGLTSITIPNSVTSIGQFAFSGCTGLTSITIPNSVTYIGDYAFRDCIGLTSITIPNSVTSIGQSAFSGCTGLTSITIPNSVTYIGDYAFRDCIGLTSITIPNSVTSIGQSAFSGCTGLTSITIPNSVTSIREYTFSGCTKLSNVIFEDGTTTLSLGQSNNYNSTSIFQNCPISNLYMGRNINSSYVFQDLTTLTTLIIGNSVTSTISVSAFSSCTGLTSIAFGSGLTNNLPEALLGSKHTSLTTITVNDENMTYSSIDGVLFNKEKTELLIFPRAKSGNTYFIPNNVTNIRREAFRYCTGLTSVVIPNSVTSIREYTFSDCIGLTSITIPKSITSIGDRAFSNCRGLTNVTIPASVINIDNFAFLGCTELMEINIDTDNEVYSSEDGVWFNKNKTELILYPMKHGLSYSIPAGVMTIGYSAFNDCTGLTSITISNSVTSIREYTFSGCTGLTSITIPNSVTSIGYSAFSGCTSLNTVNFNATNCTLPDYTYNYVFSNCTAFATLNIGDNVTRIPAYAFYGCDGLKSITIPKSVTSIGDRAFAGCSSLTDVNFNAVNCTSMGSYYPVFDNSSALTTVNIGDEVKTIPNIAFYGCRSLKSIAISNSVTTIGFRAFSGCSNLTNISIPNSVTSIESNAFEDCLGLTGTLIIPNSVASIGSSAFSGCSGLTSVIIPQSVTSIRSFAFYNCSSLIAFIVSEQNPNFSTIDGVLFNKDKTTLITYLPVKEVTNYTIPESVTSIGRDAFQNCKGLTNVTISTSVTRIESSAFEDCSGLTSVVIPQNITSIGDRAFAGCTGLKEIVVEWQTPLSIVSSNVFSTNVDISKIKLLVPFGTANAYRNADVWKDFQIEDTYYSDISIDEAEPLFIGEATKTVTLKRNQYKLYKLSLEQNQTVRISDSEGTANIAVAYGQVPNLDSRQGSLYISNAMQGDYYVLAFNNPLNARQSQTYSLTAQLMDMEITEVFADTIVRHGSALIPIEIIGCAEIPRFALVGQDGKHYEAEKVHVFSETLYSAQFRVDSLAIGKYGLFVASGEKNGLKSDAIYLKEETPRKQLETKIVLPSTSRIGTTVTAYVEYVNTGNVDISAPLLVLSGTAGSTYQVGESEVYKDELHLVGLNAMGVINRLRPGEGGRIEVKIGIPNEFISTADYKIRVLSHNAKEMDTPFYLQWLDVEPSVRPEAYTQAEWDGYVSRLRNLTGDTWSSFVEGVNTVEELLWDTGLATVDAHEVYGYMKEMAKHNPENEISLQQTALRASHAAEDVEPGTIFIWNQTDWKQLVKYENREWKRIMENIALFDPNKQTFFVSHGWNDDRFGNAAWYVALALSARFPNQCNIITVDWSRLSNTGKSGILSTKHNLPIALDHLKVDNIPILGPAINSGYVIPSVAERVYKNLCLAITGSESLKPILKNFHLIGHSHGAHVCGMLAEEFKRYGNKPERLTCLDASTDLGHINSANPLGKGWSAESATYVDYYKSSVLCGTESLKGQDNFILIEKNNGFNFNVLNDAHRHSYAIDWYITTINNSSIPLGFNFNETVRNNLKWGNNIDWSKKPEKQWHGVINGSKNTIECLSVRETLNVEPKDWRYTAPWYSGEKGLYFDDKKFRDAIAGTFEFDVNEQSIVIPEERIVAGTNHTITLSYSNKADNFTVEGFAAGEYYKNSGNALFVSKDNKLDAGDYPVDDIDNLHFAKPGVKDYTYNREVNFSRNLWRYLGGNDETNSIDCYLFFAAGITCPKDALPTTRDLITPWKGELYPENNIVSKQITIYKSDLWCDAGPNQTLYLGKTGSVHDVHLNGEVQTSLQGQTVYNWFYNGTIISVEKSFTYYLPAGTHTIELRVSNGDHSASDQVVITIEPHRPDGDEGGSGSTSTIGSCDPNEKVGVKGAGDKDCVLPKNTMDYTIFFENDPEKATAPAQEVRVTDVLDEAFDLSTFSFTGVRVANEDIAVQGNVAYTSVTTDLRPDNNLLLRTTLGLNVDTRTVTATFTSLDPETEKFTTDPSAGFLYPNDSTHRGEGHFSYRVALKDNLPDNYQVTNQAHIYFDNNNPIATNITSHTIDVSAPSSSVTELSATVKEDSVSVSWNGADWGAGIRYYNIYVSDNDDTYTLWKEKTTDTSACFHGKAGHTYSFFSIAADLLGHTEMMKQQAEARVTLGSTDIQYISTVSNMKVYPNPTTGILYIENVTGYEKRIYNILGKLLLVTQEDKIGMSDYPNGVYMLHINDVIEKIVKQ